VAEEHDFPFGDLFLLQPRLVELAATLAPLDGNDFSSIHSTTQQLFAQGVKALQSGDESILDNVLVVGVFQFSNLILKTMRIFLNALLGRRYHNFSSDIILLMTGLGAVDDVFGVQFC
jgi:hypothetical protein